MKIQGQGPERWSFSGPGWRWRPVADQTYWVSTRGTYGASYLARQGLVMHSAVGLKNLQSNTFPSSCVVFGNTLRSNAGDLKATGGSRIQSTVASELSR